MGVKCPKHNAELKIEYTSIDLLGNKYPVVTGECPVCKVKYLSREIMSSSGSFKIAGQVYEYLSEMANKYPYSHTTESKDKGDTSNDKPAINAEKATNKVLSKRQKRIEAQKKQQQEFAEKRKQNEAKAAKRAADATKRQMEAREAAILEVRQRNELGLNKSYRVKKLHYLSNIPERCTHDGEKLDYVKNIQIELGGTSIKRASWCCFRCRTAFFLNSERNEITEKINRAQQKALDKKEIRSIPKVEKKKDTELVNLAIPENTLYVCKGTISCRRSSHSIESATGLLMGKNGTIIRINANYCPQCRKYFISHDEYIAYRKLYGILLGNIKVTNGSFIGNEANLAEESILHMCGYSVNQTDNLSSPVRQGILQYLIDSKVSNKPEITDYLNFFIKRNGKRQNMEEAVRRWNDDLKWVREYQINRQRYFEILDIQRYKK